MMKTYQCTACHAICTANHPITQCLSCQAIDTMILKAHEESLHIQMIQKNDTVIVEYKSADERKIFQWDSICDRDLMREHLCGELARWLVKSLDSA